MLSRHGAQGGPDERVLPRIAAVVVAHALFRLAVFPDHACHQAGLSVFAPMLGRRLQSDHFGADEVRLLVGGHFPLVADVVDGSDVQVVH